MKRFLLNISYLTNKFRQMTLIIEALLFILGLIFISFLIMMKL
jgi:hypothetical protein